MEVNVKSRIDEVCSQCWNTDAQVDVHAVVDFGGGALADFDPDVSLFVRLGGDLN